LHGDAVVAAWRARERGGARGIAEGDLPPSADVDQLAAFYTTVLEGLSIQARDGASEEKPNRITDAPMLAWPPV